MTTTAFTTSPTPTSSAAAPATVAATHGRTAGRRMWVAGALAAVASSLVVIAVVAIAQAAGVPMEVAENSTKPPERVPLLGYVTVIGASVLVGLLLATAVVRWARRPRRTFVVATVALAAVSFAFPTTTSATLATKIVLDVTHVIPAVIVIPTIAAFLTSRRDRGTRA